MKKCISLEGLDSVQTNRYNKRKDSGNRNSKNCQKHCVLETVYKSAVANDPLEVLDTELKLKIAADLLEESVAVPERHTERIENRPDCENEQENNSGREIYPRLPLIKLDLLKEIFH